MHEYQNHQQSGFFKLCLSHFDKNTILSAFSNKNHCWILIWIKCIFKKILLVTVDFLKNSYLENQMALPNNLTFQIFSSYHFDAIVLEREFPLDLYPWRNETDVSSTQGTAAKNYDFLNSLFPIGILIIILILVFICTRRNVCLLKSWGKWNKFDRLARDWSSKFVTDKWSFYNHFCQIFYQLCT